MASTAELEAEILADLEENPDAYTAPINDIITIDPETRTINLPASETLFGTEQEMNVERKYFKCPKIAGDNIDLSKHQIYITYVTARDNTGTFLPEEELGLYYCEDMAVDGDYITFSWLLSGNVLRNHGFIAFAVSAKHMDGEVLKTRWKTKPAVGTVLLTVPDGEAIVERYPDIITQLLDRMGAMEEIATVEAMQGYVDDYLGRNPVQLDSTLTDPEKAAPANVVGELKSKKVDNPPTGAVGQILEIETVDENGKPKTYKAVDKPTSSGEVSDEQISSAVSEYMANNPIEESDPTVPEWAKSPQKPTYTASEVGADAAGTAESKVSEHNVSDTAHNDIRMLVQGLTERLNALADSDDETLDRMSEIVSYIKYNRSLINGIDTNKVDVSDIINNLTSNNTNKPLSAKQGRVLKSLIDAITVVELDESLTDNTKAAPAGVVGELKSDITRSKEAIKELSDKKITKFYASNLGNTTMNDSDNGKITDMKLYGKSFQQTYTGKNLLNTSVSTETVNGVTIKKNDTDGTFTLNGTATSDIVFELNNFMLEKEPYQFKSFKIHGSYNGNVLPFCLDASWGNHMYAKIDGDAVILRTYNAYNHWRIAINSGSVCNNLTIGIMVGNDLTDYEPYVGCIPSPNPDYPQEIKSVVNPVVKVYDADGTHTKTASLPYTLNAIPVTNGGNVTIDGQQYIADYVDVERGKLVRIVDSSKLDNTQSIIDKTEWLLAEQQETDLTTEQTQALKELATYYSVTNISVNSEQLDGYTVFNYPISMANGWNYVKQQLGDTRDYIYDMDLQSAEAYVNSEYAVALAELEV